MRSSVFSSALAANASSLNSSSAMPDGEAAPELLDERLHYGRAWHRYGYVYRRPQPGRPRILDAWSAGRRAAVEAARLNPRATVIAAGACDDTAFDVSEFADRVETRTHDPREPLPESWGRFDFIVCRHVFESQDDPARLLAHLAQALDPSGLLFATFPNHRGLAEARSLRQAVDALAPPEADDEERRRLALDLFEALRPDHPIRTRALDAGRDPEAFVDLALAGRRAWTLDEAVAALGPAGLRFLYAATPWRWRPDRALDLAVLPAACLRRIDRLAPDQLSQLVDALDPALLDDHYGLYACPAGHTPDAPEWPTARLDDPAAFNRLVPHLTGLAAPAPSVGSASQNRVIFRTVSGGLGEIDRLSNLMLSGVNGQSTCGQIEAGLAHQMRASDDLAARQRRWIELADCGLILLESPEAA